MVNTTTQKELEEQLMNKAHVMAAALKDGQRLELAVSRSGRVKIYACSKRQLRSDDIYTPVGGRA